MWDAVVSDAVGRKAVIDACNDLVRDLGDSDALGYSVVDASASEAVVQNCDVSKKRKIVNRVCRASQCNNNPQRNPDLRFHRFPKNEKLKRKWLVASCPLPQDRCWTPSKYSTLCSEHFTPDSYHRSLEMLQSLGMSTRYSHLKQNAVPTVFRRQLPPQMAQAASEEIYCMEVGMVSLGFVLFSIHNIGPHLYALYVIAGGRACHINIKGPTPQ